MSPTRPHQLRLQAVALVALLALTGAARASDGHAIALARARAPHLTLTGHPRVRIHGTSTTIAFHVAGKGISVRCRLDARAFQACHSPLRMTGLAPGAHLFHLRARNRYGTSRISVRWVVSPPLEAPIASTDEVPPPPPLFPSITTPIVTQGDS
jgi:hypothetical protein